MERDLGARTVRAMQSACKQELSETFRYNFSDLAILDLDPALHRGPLSTDEDTRGAARRPRHCKSWREGLA